VKATWRSYIIGMHNPIVHGLGIVEAWIKLYRCLPSVKECVCIFFHDIGYLRQNEIDGVSDRHPEFGAEICGLMGEQYYWLCICHSRSYAKKLNKPLSKLCYADKACLLMYPGWFFKRLIWIGGEAATLHQAGDDRWGIPVNVYLIRREFAGWLAANFVGYNWRGNVN
jgi:hypothetical protein